MALQTPLSFTVRACGAAALLALITACGGGSGSGASGVPLGPIAAPDSPAATPAPRLPAIFQPAEAVLGQANLEVGEVNRGQDLAGPQTLHLPVGMALTPAGGLLVVDAGNSRVLLFPSVPATMGPDAEGVLGQPDLHTGGPSLAQGGLNLPFGVAVGAGRMAVADAEAHRVLIYAEVPALGRPMPQPVAAIGQPDFETGVPDCSRAGLAFPSSVAITPEGKLIVADSWNHRVLVWGAMPARQEDVLPPSLVLGQRLLNSCIRNDDDESGEEDFDSRTGLSRASARTLRFPSGVWSDGDRLVVADTANHRVLIWKHFPQDDFQEADIVLGHPGFTETTPNNQQVPMTAGTLFGPQDVDADGTSLAVVDTANNRVLIWKSFPEHDFQPADIVLGHDGFGQRVVDDQDGDGWPDAPTARILNRPLKVLFTPDALLVSDSFHHRVLMFRR